MQRRDLLTAGIGATVLAVTTTAFADDKKPAAPKAPPPKQDARAALLDALEACQAKAVLCDAHCATELANGNKEFAHCAAAVADVLAVTAALRSLVARKSAAAKQLASVCAATCKDCSAACNEHKAHWAHNMHLECRDCMEACDTCAKACAAFAAG